MEERKTIYLGRIKYTIARLAHIKCADITVDYNHLVHIGRQHINELTQMNVTALDYIKSIVDDFDEIRERPDNAVMLVHTNTPPPHDTCIVELCYNADKDNWQVRTAQPRRDVSKDKLLWKKKEAE